MRDLLPIMDGVFLDNKSCHFNKELPNQNDVVSTITTALKGQHDDHENKEVKTGNCA